MGDGVNGTHPVIDADDMLPDGSDVGNPSGLTLGYIPMPCLSRAPIGHFGNMIGSRGSAPITETILEIFVARAHSPELPQFSARSSKSITGPLSIMNNLQAAGARLRLLISTSITPRSR